jgi:hypothetical protein
MRPTSITSRGRTTTTPAPARPRAGATGSTCPLDATVPTTRGKLPSVTWMGTSVPTRRTLSSSSAPCSRSVLPQPLRRPHPFFLPQPLRRPHPFFLPQPLRRPHPPVVRPSVVRIVRNLVAPRPRTGRAVGFDPCTSSPSATRRALQVRRPNDGTRSDLSPVFCGGQQQAQKRPKQQQTTTKKQE